MTENFEKLRAYFDCLSELEASNGGYRDTDSLRDLLKRNSLLLGIEQNKNKSI